jgi:glycosyltransferase involved in cell wall biosynthesis
MKKIVYISPVSSIGGGEISLLTLLNNLDREMFQPFLICYEDGPLVQKAKQSSIDVLEFKRDSFLSNVLLIWKIFKYIRQNHIDLVHVNSLDIRAGIAAWLAMVPLIGHLRVIFPFTWRDRLFARLSLKLIAVSNAVVDSFCRKRPFYRDKFILIPNAVEISNNLVPAPLKEEFGLPEVAKLVGAVGRIDPWKGYEFFLESAVIIKKLWRNVFFFIVGGVVHKHREGKLYSDMLKKKTTELNLQDCLIFTGFREDILRVIKSFDVLVVPSIILKRDRGEVTEGFGRVAIEAMAAMVPVVATNTGGLPEIVEDNISGMLVPPGDPHAMAEAVISFLADPVKARIFGKAGRKRVEELFTVQQHIKNIQNLYLRMISKGRKPS